MNSKDFIVLFVMMCAVFVVVTGILVYYPDDFVKPDQVVTGILVYYPDDFVKPDQAELKFKVIETINMSNSSITVDIPPQLPIWMAVVKEIDYNFKKVDGGFVFDINYDIDIKENDRVRKSFKNITNEKMITVLTYYNKNYGLNKIDAGMTHMVRENGMIHFVQYRNYTEYIGDVWEYQNKPITKYDIKEFAPEYTPEPTLLPTFNADKWYKESLT
jgi:hypothetical protein